MNATCFRPEEMGSNIETTVMPISTNQNLIPQLSRIYYGAGTARLPLPFAALPHAKLLDNKTLEAKVLQRRLLN